MTTPRLPPRPAVVAGLALRGVLLRAADRLVPAEAALLEATLGVATTHLAATLAELGVPAALAGRRATAAELAPDLGADPDTLHRVLRAAAVRGLVRLDRRGRFRLTRTGRALGGGWGAWARYLALTSTGAAWRDLPASARDGRSAFRRVHGRSVWEHFAAHPDEERLFAEGMRALTELDVPAIMPAYPWPEDGVVADLAGGVGTLLAAVLDARPALRGVLVDAPGVLAEADAVLAGRGVRERVELVPGDLFGALEARADLYLLKDVLHDWDDAACARILAGVRATMRPGARLLVVELAQERDRAEPFVSLADVQMLTQCEDGRQRSVAELRALLAGAGLTPAAVHRGPVPARVLLEAVAPG